MEEVEKNMNIIQKDLERVYPGVLKAVLLIWITLFLIS